MIAIIDYGVGNIFSLEASIKKIGERAIVTDDVEVIKKADRLILPGVGAFAQAIANLKAKGLDTVLKQQIQGGKELLGICLGMQLLFEKSCEYGEHEGLGILKGEIIPMENTLPQGLKIPHIGWNRLNKVKSCRILESAFGKCVYFVHSFYGVNCDESLVATTEYGKEIAAAVAYKNVYGCQFHPEKSGDVGLGILKEFCKGEVR